MTKALICGVCGQDGAYLAQHLLSLGYEVYGTSRDAELTTATNLDRLGIREQVKLLSMSLVDFRSVIQTIARVEPDEIYNLAGQSSVGLSFEQPVETLESIAAGTLNLLEAIRFYGGGVRFYNASSSECFGNVGDNPASEETPFRPRSPYAVAKSAAHWEVVNYREAYDLFACSGILFNHESPLRHERFVTQKVVAGAVRISRGQQKGLQLGDISIKRDWGWAPEYVVAMHLMLGRDEPEDFVIATAQTYSLEDLVSQAFECVGMNWKDHVTFDPSLRRESEIDVGRADPAKAAKLLGWKAEYAMPEVVSMMIREFG